jgi:hypothetical protein
MAVLDDLVSELSASVRLAVVGRKQAGLVAEFEGMRSDLENAAGPIGEVLVVLEVPDLALDEETVERLAARREVVRRRFEQVREALADEPAAIRRGTLWRDTRQAVIGLRGDAVAARAEAYRTLLEPYSDGDRDLANSLPPNTKDLDEFRKVLNQYEATVERIPRSANEVAQAAATGRKLKEIRERVEAGAVPEAFRVQWRDLRGPGLPVRRLTPEFRAWLDERGLAANVLLHYRGV